MTPEQQRKMLECAAKACGLSVKPMEIKNVTAQGDDRFIGLLAEGWPRGWFDPLANPADTAEMCAKLEINTFFYVSLPRIECWCEDHGNAQTIRHIEYHNRTDAEKAKAWRLAATIVAAKTQGYEP